jgi:hypothetical protein
MRPATRGRDWRDARHKEAFNAVTIYEQRRDHLQLMKITPAYEILTVPRGLALALMRALLGPVLKVLRNDSAPGGGSVQL